MMPCTGGFIVGILSIAGLIFIYRHADALGDGNIGGDPNA